MELEGDFLGFKIGNYHSKDLGMVRTSSGFISDDLLPKLQDISITIPKGKGSLYYGSTYTQRNFQLAFAFEKVSEQQISQWKIIFNDKKIQKLILDETPYKSYRVKPTGVSTIKHLAFTDGEKRYYNGEGTISFVCYFPFAISEYSTLTTGQQDAPWASASDIPFEDSGIMLQPSIIDGKAEGYLYNSGDTVLMLEMEILKTSTDNLTIELQCRIQEETQVFKIENMPWTNLTGVHVDFFRGDIYGLDLNEKDNGKSYFTYMVGDYIYIPSKELCYYNITTDNADLQVKFIPHYLYV